MKHDNHLKSALSVIDQYNGAVPLSVSLKDFFRRHRQMGARDRRQISSLAYHYFRLGHALKDTCAEDRIQVAVFLCEQVAGDWLEYFRPEWSRIAGCPLKEKLEQLQKEGFAMSLSDIFPWRDELSAGVDFDDFSHSFLRQPKLFIRVRSQKARIIEILKEQQVSFEEAGASCIALPNGTKAEQLIPDKSLYEIQDLSSQRVQEYFSAFGPLLSGKESTPPVWDCCAGSGGKSILLKDIYPGVRLTVSDIRPSILENLKKRMNMAGMAIPVMRVADIGRSLPGVFLKEPFSVIIADVPCTGSGTWARTPEQLYYFNPARLRNFSDRQKRISGNVLPALKKGGGLLYITCSVFRRENEMVVQELQEKHGLRLLRSGLLEGYGQGADTLFAAAFLKDQ